MTFYQLVIEFAFVPLGLIAALVAAVALIQPRRVPARATSHIGEVPLPR